MDLRLKVDASGGVTGFADFDRAAQKSQSTATQALGSISSAFDQLQSRVFNLKTAAFSVVTALGLDKVAQHLGKLETLNIALAATTGSAVSARDAFARLGETASKFGFQADDVAVQFAKFLEATKSMGFTTQQADRMFRGLSAGVRAFGGDANQVNEAIATYIRLMSRGGAEGSILMRQLKDLIPGTFEASARALGVTQAKFREMLDTGVVPFRKLMLALPEEIEKRFGDAAVQAGNSISGLQAKLHDAIQGMMEGTGAGGFAEAYKRLIQKTIDVLEDPRAQEAARKFGELLSQAIDKVIDAMDWATKHTDQLKTAFEAIIAMKLGSWFIAVAADVQALIKAFQTLGGTAAFRWFAGSGAGATAGAVGAGAYVLGSADKPQGIQSFRGGAYTSTPRGVNQFEETMPIYGQLGSVAGPLTASYADALIASYSKLHEKTAQISDDTNKLAVNTDSLRNRMLELADATEKYLAKGDEKRMAKEQAQEMIDSWNEMARAVPQAFMLRNQMIEKIEHDLSDKLQDIEIERMTGLLEYDKKQFDKMLDGWADYSKKASLYAAKLAAIQGGAITGNMDEFLTDNEKAHAQFRHLWDKNKTVSGGGVNQLSAGMQGLQDVIGSVSQSFDSFFSGIAAGTNNGRSMFQGMAESVVAALNRVVMKMTVIFLLEQALGWLGSLFKPMIDVGGAAQALSNPIIGGFATGHAIGGPFNAGSNFIVGKNLAENGPELIHMNGSGSVQPLMPTQTKTVVNNYGTPKNAKTSTRYDPTLKEMVTTIVLSDLERNGPMARAGLRR